MGLVTSVMMIEDSVWLGVVGWGATGGAKALHDGSILEHHTSQGKKTSGSSPEPTTP